MTEQEQEFPQNQEQAADEASGHVSVGIDAELEARLDAYAADTGKTRSAAVRDLVKAGLTALLARGYDAAGQGSDAAAGEDADNAGQAAEATGVDERNNNDDAPEAMDSLAVSYVSGHPRATMAEIAVGLGLSRSAAIRRMQDVCAKGLASNAGTDRHPLWEVPGVEHAPEELLTERQARVLACLRRDPVPATAQIAAELGCAASTVNNEYRALETRGLAHRASRGRWAAVGSAADVEPAYADALSYLRDHPNTTVSATAKAMSVTRYTARHDLQTLESQGLVAHNPDGTWSATATVDQGDPHGD